MTSISPRDLELHTAFVIGDPNGVQIIRRNADLQGEDLSGADLRFADLRFSNLQYADLEGANLQYANLGGADMHRADLKNADLRNAIGLFIAEDAPSRLVAVAKSALQPGALEMQDRFSRLTGYDWLKPPTPSGETARCLRGWAVHQAGEVGRVLAATVGNQMAGLYLLGAEAALHFFDSNEDATSYLQSVIDVANAIQQVKDDLGTLCAFQEIAADSARMERAHALADGSLPSVG